MDSYTMDTTIPRGTVLPDGSVILHDVIGRGSYGHIYLGERTHPSLNTINTPAFVAVKTIPKAGLPQSQIDLLHIEFDLQRSLAPHKNIVTAHDILEDDQYVYMVIELCEGGDLFDLIAREQHVGPSGAAGIRDQNLTASIFRDIVHALSHAHRNGVFHRDIKPENVVATGDGKHWKLVDFGLATRDRESFEHETGSSVYIAPEQFTLGKQGLPYKTDSADVWSLGVLLLAMIVGRHPWTEANENDLAFAEFLRSPKSLLDSFPALSDSAWSLISRMLDINPATRITLSELESLIDSTAQLEPFQNTSPSVTRSRRSTTTTTNIPEESSAPLVIQQYPNPATKRDSFDSGFGSWAEVADLELDFNADPFATHRSGTDNQWSKVEQRSDDADDYMFEMEI